jgi:BirA family biotin operon repressor/biotin-[acetyl-CoA-carboxylase] ligase
MKNRLLSVLSSHPWANAIHWYDTIDSTNTEAKRLAAAGAPHGTICIADHQTGGRGRMGRSFHSPAGTGLYLSVLLRPECPASELMHLTCATAVAACDAVEHATGLRPGIKWTNDLVWGRKKLGGILTELSLGQDGQVAYAVIGIGINCAQGAADFPKEIADIVTSLSLCTEKSVDRVAVAAALIDALRYMSAQLQEPSAFLDRYRTGCITLGQEISLVRGEEIRHGKALDIDEQGALLVQFPDGHTEAVNSGEVSVRGMYGYV